MNHFFEWFYLGIIACWALLGIPNAIRMRRKGVPVLAVDRKRSAAEMLADSVAVPFILWFFYEMIAHAWPIPFHLGPAFLDTVLVEHWGWRVLGCSFLIDSVVLYGWSLKSLGTSWRLGIDRENTGPLVTQGIYAIARHPIYLAFNCWFLGTFLVLGNAVFLVFLVVLPPLLHYQMIREERFLLAQFGDAYRNYAARVGRYFTWP